MVRCCSGWHPNTGESPYLASALPLDHVSQLQRLAVEGLVAAVRLEGLFVAFRVFIFCWKVDERAWNQFIKSEES